jgi:protein TonB
MSPAYGQTGNWRTLSVVSGLHVVAALALLSTEPVAKAVGLPQPLMVSLLANSEPEPPKVLPKPLPPKPQPVQQVQPPPVLAVQTEAPSPIAVQIPPAPLPLPAVLPAPAPVPVKPTVAAAVAAPPPPAPITPPRFDADYLDNPAPSYPALSRRTGEYGRVLLRVYVSPDGAAAQVEIRESSGYDRLDRAARNTVQRWRFVPAKQGERGIAAWVLVPISFSLRS